VTKKKNKTRELAEELDLLDDMLTSLVELLEEKRIITQKEWEERIKRRVESKPSQSIRDLDD
jgi:hypothetical protein